MKKKLAKHVLNNPKPLKTIIKLILGIQVKYKHYIKTILNIKGSEIS